jgi:hypothetical protein
MATVATATTVATTQTDAAAGIGRGSHLLACAGCDTLA